MSPRLFGAYFVLQCCVGWALSANSHAQKFRYPMTTSGTYITAYYDLDRGGGLRDWAGGKKTYNNHSGSDYGVGGWPGMDRGVQIRAAADGTVAAAVDGQFDRCTTARCSPCNGNYVKIQHSGGKVSYYLHIKKGTVKVRRGQKVRCGDVLGLVGSSGCSTGPHLHFQVNAPSARCPFVHNDWVSKGGYRAHPSTQCQGGSPPPPPPPSGCSHVKPARLGGLTLRIRASSNTSSAAIGAVPEGVCLKVLQKASGQNILGNTTWYKISYNNVTGWISGYYADCSSCGGPAPECSNGKTKSCYTGPSGTKNRGICREGKQTCRNSKWSKCEKQIGPKSESCNGKDDDCDGKTDENNPGGGASCSTGKPGLCGAGTKQCKSGKLTCIAKQSSPQPERCNGKDDNCDGQTDEGNPGGGASCNTGNQGACGAGTQQCKSGKLVCVGRQAGSQELCDGQDNDCNGQIDDGLQRTCYDGPGNTNNVGICKGGQSICLGGRWSACQGQVKPFQQEQCGNGKDDNCNGQTDENCGTCTDGQRQPCYSGPPATRDVGTCRSGNQTCQGGKWGTCQGETVPADQEHCDNGQDDNCDGQTDENCSTGPCTEGKTRSCYHGPSATRDVGTCKSGNQTCQNGTWSDCRGQIMPAANELCGNSQDDNCDGQIDENCDGPGGCMDNDKDGFGAGASCSNALDCDDTNPNIHPNAQEICGNNIDENCDGNDDCGPAKKPMGAEGCNQAQDCETKICVRHKGTSRCSMHCKSARDCPTGYTCLQQKACWPNSNTQTQTQTCQTNQNCPSGQLCHQGFCEEKQGCGCQSQPTPNHTGIPWFLVCWMLWLCLRIGTKQAARLRPSNPPKNSVSLFLSLL